jgi:hypothetical protein
MRHDHFRHALMLVPLAVAALVTLGVPALLDGHASLLADDPVHALYIDCQARHGPPASSAAHTGPRSQSPEWLQQRQGEITRCLQAGGQVTKQADAR